MSDQSPDYCASDFSTPTLIDKPTNSLRNRWPSPAVSDDVVHERGGTKEQRPSQKSEGVGAVE